MTWFVVLIGRLDIDLGGEVGVEVEQHDGVLTEIAETFGASGECTEVVFEAEPDAARPMLQQLASLGSGWVRQVEPDTPWIPLSGFSTLL